MKKVISLFLSLAMLLSVVSVVDFSAFASVKTGSCGNNVTYSLDTSTGVLTISGTGAMNDYSSTNSPFKYNSDVKSVIIENGITSIGDYAFCGCTSLTSVTIPNGVNSIGNYAFSDCTSLTDITIPNSVISIGNYAFSDCTSLTNITIPNSVTSIGSSAFRGCTSLTNITIPNSVTSIGRHAFWYCTSLTSIAIPDSVTSIDDSAFAHCESLASVTIPNSVKYIGDCAFDDCKSLTSVTIPNSVTSIGNNAFSDCTSLTDITIPDSVTSIKISAFSGCTSLTSVTIPDSVTSIGYSVFYNCSNLKFVIFNGTKSQWNAINISSHNENLKNAIIKCTDGLIGNGNAVTIDNLKYKIYDDTTTLVGYTGSPENLMIPKSVLYEGYTVTVTSIGDSTFKNCTSLESVNYSGTKSQWKAITIGSDNYYLTRAFIKCTDGIIGNGNTVTIDNLKYKIYDNTASLVDYIDSPENLVIPEKISYEGYTLNVTSIASAFDGCTSLTSITIPNSVTSIGSYAFRGCASLTSVTIPNSVKSISSQAFYGCTSLTKVDYNGTVSQWKSINGYGNVSKIIKCTDGLIGNGNTVTIDNLKYQLNNDNTANIVGFVNDFEDLKIPKSVTYEGYTFNVASIGDSAFKDCASLTSVAIPNSITEIGKDAFYNCTSLAKVDYNGTVSQWKSISGYNNVSKIIKCTDGVIGNRNIVIIDNLKYQLNNDNTAYIFSYVNNTKTFEIPESVTYEGYSFNVTSISSQAFYGCKSLTSITIPNSVTSIDREAFYNCSNLKFVIYNGTKTQWNAISISNSYNSYLTGAIIKCTDGLIGNGNTVTIDNLKYQLNNDQTASLVGYTGSLENLMIPEKISYEGYTFNVTSIGDKAFYNCTSLTDVTIPNSVTSIGTEAFFGCTSLTSVTIPDSVTSISQRAFDWCDNLKSVNYNGTKAKWKSISGYSNVSQIIKCTDGIYANSNTIYIDSVKYRLNDDYTAEVTDYSGTSENITIPESVTYEGLTFKVTSIGSSAFSGCTSLTSITIPDSVTTIDNNAFNGCSKLKKIEIPDSVTYIGSKAFDGTAFYNTVKNWENGVLYSGNHLISAKSDVTKITVKASTVSIAAGALDNCKSLEKINVLNPKCVINCTIPKTAVIGGAEGSTAEDFAQKNNMSIDYFEECTHSDKVQVVIAATCTEQGVVQSRCADCDKLISQTFTAPLGHTMVITTPAKVPTCTTSGNTQAGYCTVCGYNEVSTVIPATGHNFGNNSANCLVCGTANPNYVAPTPAPSPAPTPAPTPTPTPTQPTQISKPVAKPKSAKIKKVKAAKKAVSVEWKKVSGVKGYQVQVATDKKFKKNKKTVTVKKQKTTKVTIKKLKAKKKYYVRIRTYKTVNGKKVYSSWSKVKTVKTK